MVVVGTSDHAVLSCPDFLLSLTWVLAPSRLAHRGLSNPAMGGTWLYHLPGMTCPVVRTGTVATKVANYVQTVDENAIRIAGC